MGATWKVKFTCSVLLAILLFQNVVESVVASEWSLAGPADEYVMAKINVTYINPHSGKIHTENGEVGKYGMGKVVPAMGLVVHVKSPRGHDGKINHYGCEPLAGPIPDEPWIALIKRGNCNFDKKLDNAQARKAVAMVVYDLEDRDTLEKMGLGNCRNCSIPGVFTFKRIGEEIANITDEGTRVDMVITIGETCSRPYSGINRTSVLFVSISFIVLMIISLAWLVFYYVQRFRYLHAKDRLAQRLCNAAKKALAKIPTRNIKLTDKEITGEAECCAVCIEFYASGDCLRTLPCRHEFHKGCVDPWLLEHRTCPMCKMDILKYYGFIFTGSQESILHLDLEDGNIISSESRETASPTQEEQTHPVWYAEPTDSSNQNPHSSSNSCPHQHDASIRKPSLISLTVVAASRGYSNNPTTTEALSQTEDCMGDQNIVSLKCDCQREMSSSIPDYQKQHPMCYVHEDGGSRQSLEDSSSETGGVPASHQPLIHREDSGSLHLQRSDKSNSNLSSRQEQIADGSSPSESESHHQDFNKKMSQDTTPEEENVSVSKNAKCADKI